MARYVPQLSAADPPPPTHTHTHTHKEPHTVLNSLHRQQFYNHETGIFVGPTGCRPYYGSVRVV